MKFSIIIPTLNEAQSLPACLSALEPLRPDSEIIVCDGGSTDNTVTIARKSADHVIESDKGRARQMNAGAKAATGNILLFLHADTLLPENALHLLSRPLVEASAWGRFDIELTGGHFMLRVIAQMMNWRSRLTGIATGDQAIFVNREAFASVGGFPEIALMEDIALSTSLKKIAPPLCLKEKAVSSGRRWEKFGITKTIMLMWNLRIRYFFGADPDILASLYYKGH
ncbi:MAG: TIGR04283 family arsenosugar biosynthesis glycosyltransferase [Gammaproteobacteria bacterium]